MCECGHTSPLCIIVYVEVKDNLRRQSSPSTVFEVGVSVV